LSSPSGGEDYALSIIVNDRLAAKDWEGAADQLRKYLSLNRGPKAAARAHFYLGQALSYSGDYRDAFFEFLSARELYSTDSKAWIEYVLSRLKSGA
jgi:TolA-binding protein